MARARKEQDEKIASPVTDADSLQTTSLNELEGENIESTDKTQEEAEKVIEEATKGQSQGKYKLADPRTQYAEGEFTLVGEQEKELPEHPSPGLVERIRAGFIVKA